MKTYFLPMPYHFMEKYEKHQCGKCPKILNILFHFFFGLKFAFYVS